MYSLDEIFKITVLNNTTEQWVVSLSIFIISASLLYISYYFLLRTLKKLIDKTETELDDFLYEIINDTKHSIVLLFSFYFSIQFINLSPTVNLVIQKIILVYLTIRVTFFVQRFLISKVQKSILRYLDRLNANLQKRVRPILGKILSTLLWITAILLIVGNLGYNLTSLIAGLGIGGIFIGLAAQETLSNFFSSLSLFLDQPFDVGDIVEIGDIEGTVEDFGMRSTRVRLFDSTLVIIPNNQIAQDKINNLSKRRGRKTVLQLGLVYSTSTDKLKEALQIIKDTLASNINVQEKGVRVHFVNFGASSLDIEVIYFVDLLDTYNKIQNVREEVNIRIMSLFEKAKIEFAYPTQTIYLEKN